MHCPNAYLETCPILLRTQANRTNSLGERPFRFEAVWFSHRELLRFTEANMIKANRGRKLLRSLLMNSDCGTKMCLEH